MTEPINHLADKSGYTQELLTELTNAELDEQEAYYQSRRDWCISHPDEGQPDQPYKSSVYAAHRYGNMVSAIKRERESRHR